MIYLTGLHGRAIYVNPDQIQSIEETPDTHVTLMNGNIFIVVDKTEKIVEKIITFKSAILRRAGGAPIKKYLVKRRTSGYHVRTNHFEE